MRTSLLQGVVATEHYQTPFAVARRAKGINNHISGNDEAAATVDDG